MEADNRMMHGVTESELMGMKKAEIAVLLDNTFIALCEECKREGYVMVSRRNSLTRKYEIKLTHPEDDGIHFIVRNKKKYTCVWMAIEKWMEACVELDYKSIFNDNNY